MKVLLILPDSPIQKSGGLGERWFNLLQYLNFDIDCFCPGYDHRLNTTNIFGFVQENSSYFAIGYTITKQIANKLGTYDVMITSDHFTIPVGFYISQLLKIPWILEFNLALFSYQKLYDPEKLHPYLKAQSDYINYLEKLGAEYADKVVLCSQYYYEELPYKTKNFTKPVVIPNGVNFEEFEVSTDPFQFPGNKKFNVVYIGRLNTQKGVHLLLKCQLPKDVALHFVGGAEGSDLYNDVVSSCDNENKFYLGYKTGKEKVQILKSADAIIFPSLHEPFGIVGLEAIASKTLLITTRTGGIASYISADNCIVCEPTIESVENAINKAISLDKQKKQEMIESAYSNARQSFSWREIAKQYESVIQEVATK